MKVTSWTKDYRSIFQSGSTPEKTTIRNNIYAAYVVACCGVVATLIWVILVILSMGVR